MNKLRNCVSTGKHTIVRNAPCNFVERVEDERIPPHGNSHRIIAERQAEDTDEESFGLREYPDTQ